MITIRNDFHLFDDADTHGLVEVQPGVFLQTAQNMVEEQSTWPDEDPAKGMDFSVAPYWVTTDDGVTPIPVWNEEDLVEVVPDIGETP